MLNTTQLGLLRKSKNLTMEEAAKKLGISRNTLAAYESGKTKVPLSVFVRMADLYNCDVFDMFGVYAPYIEYDTDEDELIEAHAKFRIKAEKAKDEAYGKSYLPDKYYEDRYKQYIEETKQYYKPKDI